MNVLVYNLRSLLGGVSERNVGIADDGDADDFFTGAPPGRGLKNAHMYEHGKLFEAPYVEVFRATFVVENRVSAIQSLEDRQLNFRRSY